MMNSSRMEDNEEQVNKFKNMVEETSEVKVKELK